jgi:hypothetical protein
VPPLLEPELELPLEPLPEPEPPDEPLELELPSKAPQKVEVPPLLAWHCQVHGPVPLTAVAVPDEQRLLVGALVRLWALDEPHMPLTAVPPLELDPEVEPEELASPDELEPEPEELEPPDELPPDEPEPVELVLPDELPLELELASKAPQKAALPPLLAWHCQVHGPVPLTADAVPAEQRLPVGALVRLWPLDEPHMPLTTTITPPPEPEPEELEPPDETLPDDPEPEPEEPVLPDVLPDELEPELDEPASPDELFPEELEPEPEELASPDELLPDELEPELEPPPEPGSGRTQRELPLSHRRAATCVSLLCRLRLLTGIVPLRVTTDHTPLVSVYVRPRYLSVVTFNGAAFVASPLDATALVSRAICCCNCCNACSSCRSCSCSDTCCRCICSRSAACCCCIRAGVGRMDVL